MYKTHKGILTSLKTAGKVELENVDGLNFTWAGKVSAG
jgi:hypothetical protein